MVRSLPLLAERNSCLAAPTHYAREATLHAELDADTVQALAIHKRANEARHQWAAVPRVRSPATSPWASANRPGFATHANCHVC